MLGGQAAARVDGVLFDNPHYVHKRTLRDSVGSSNNSALAYRHVLNIQILYLHIQYRLKYFPLGADHAITIHALGHVQI